MMMVNRLWVTALSAMLVVSLAQAHEVTTIKGFKMPESAYSASDGRVFISEIGEFGKPGDGQISVIDKQGKVSVFATGLDDPKGLTMVGNQLFVADNHRIMKIDTQGVVSVFVPENAFPFTPQFLNDLESDAAGNIYVSDSGNLEGQGGAVYKVSPAGQVSTVVSGLNDSRVLAPNGLLMGNTPNCIYMVDFVSGILYRIDMKKKSMIEVAKGFGGGDGLVKISDKQFYVSDWKSGKVYHVTLSKSEPKVELIKDGLQSAADIGLSKDGHTLMIPDMKAGEIIYLPIHKH
jgi:gluconolactonase